MFLEKAIRMIFLKSNSKNIFFEKLIAKKFY